MKKHILLFLILPILFIIILATTSVTAFAVCDGSLSFTCNTYPNHRLNASWNVTPEYGCNIYIRDSTGDHWISNNCSGSWSDTKVASNPITDDGHYKLFVSNGGSCLNQQKGEVTLNCTPIPTTCTLASWVLSNENPPANTNITARITGLADRDWSNVTWRIDGGGWQWNNTDRVISVGPPPVFEINVNSGAAGLHELEFSAGNRTRVCTPSKTFTTSGTPVPGGLTKLYVNPNPVSPGSSATITATGPTSCSTNINFNYGSGLSNCQDSGGTTCAGGHGIPGDSNPCWWRKICTAGNTGTYTASFNTDGSNCASSTSYTVSSTAPTATPTTPAPQATATPINTPAPQATATPTATPTPSSWTWQYRVSTAPFGVNNNPAWKVYSNDQGMLEDLDFGDVAIGTKLVVYAQFKSTTDQVIDVSKEIEYIGSNPEISSIACSYSPTGEGTEVKISGQNFGDQGTSSKVFFNTQEAQILSWGNQTATASAMTSTIMAKIGDRLQENLAIPLFIITADGRRAPSAGQVYCTIKATTISFNTITQCRPPQTFGNSNVRVQIYEKTAVIGVKPVYDQKITINADGTPTWVSPVLEVGKTYILVIRSPQGLGYQKEFTATVGSTVLQDLNLPVGDISPLANPDNVINSNDYSELTREWSIVSDVTRAGDFNLDKRVNSIDYSCMRNNFNQTGAKFLTGQ